MSQFDKDDVEDLGLLKLDVLGIRMQSSMAHALTEIKRVDGVEIDLDDEAQVPFDDPTTYAMISSAKTLGVFQIESPGQRELVGKSGIESFEDIITDISLFRPGPVKSDMITPYLEAKQGWRAPVVPPRGPAPDPRADPRRGGLPRAGDRDHRPLHPASPTPRPTRSGARSATSRGWPRPKLWFFPRALAHGYPLAVVERVWKVLEAFASFGFCKAHAAAFALPTYQSAWLKAHWPAHFLAGVLTHDPGMYPKRLILDDARQLGIAVLGLDVNASAKEYVVERVARPLAASRSLALRPARAYGIRLALAEVKGISEAEVERIVAARPYHSLTDFWHRARVSRPIVERLVLAGGFDSVYGIGAARRRRRPPPRPGHPPRPAAPGRRARPARPGRASRAARGRGAGRPPAERSPRPPRPGPGPTRPRPATAPTPARARAPRPSSGTRWPTRGSGRRPPPSPGRRPPPRPVTSVQLALDLGDAPGEGDGQRAAGDGRRGADAGRAGDPRPRRQPARRRHLRPRSSTRSGSPAAATCSPGAARPSCWSPGSRSPPRPRRSGPGAGSSS